MFSFSLVIILCLCFLFNLTHIKATEYYYLTIVSTQAYYPFTINFYLTVDASVVTGIYQSLPEYNNNVGNIIAPINALGGNDNTFNYVATATNYYDITDLGIGFYYGGEVDNLVVRNNQLYFVTIGSGNLGTSYTCYLTNVAPISPPNPTMFYQITLTSNIFTGSLTSIILYITGMCILLFLLLLLLTD